MERPSMPVHRAIIPTLGVFLAVACNQTVSPSREPLDWTTLRDRQMILITTTAPEGQPRTTRLWIVVLDGAAYLRSADTRWSRDVERDPNFLLIVDGTSYPVSAERVAYGTDEHARVMEAFSEKYGLLGRTVLRFYSLIGRYSGPGDARILRLKAEPPASRVRSSRRRTLDSAEHHSAGPRGSAPGSSGEGTVV
jgi:hypothetical protein